MALIYLLGVVMGVVVGAQPEWSQHLRFVHISCGLLEAVFVGLALMTGARLLIMVNNLFFVLLASREGP
ncbi:MAG: hypothetical protein VST66_03825 [Nitrospirota bacterium]|nr:hypothetical protein [Nitrospirota bacterium]